LKTNDKNSTPRRESTLRRPQGQGNKRQANGKHFSIRHSFAVYSPAHSLRLCAFALKNNL
jgi:hypothetical protein